MWTESTLVQERWKGKIKTDIKRSQKIRRVQRFVQVGGHRVNNQG